jgi:hypothetical protein
MLKPVGLNMAKNTCTLHIINFCATRSGNSSNKNDGTEWHRGHGVKATINYVCPILQECKARMPHLQHTVYRRGKNEDVVGAHILGCADVAKEAVGWPGQVIATLVNPFCSDKSMITIKIFTTMTHPQCMTASICRVPFATVCSI